MKERRFIFTICYFFEILDSCRVAFNGSVVVNRWVVDDDGSLIFLEFGKKIIASLYHFVPSKRSKKNRRRIFSLPSRGKREGNKKIREGRFQEDIRNTLASFSFFENVDRRLISFFLSFFLSDC